MGLFDKGGGGGRVEGGPVSGGKTCRKLSSKWALAVAMLRAKTVEVREARASKDGFGLSCRLRHAFLRLRSP